MGRTNLIWAPHQKVMSHADHIYMSSPVGVLGTRRCDSRHPLSVVGLFTHRLGLTSPTGMMESKSEKLSPPERP
jgi:hypothetical protein